MAAPATEAPPAPEAAPSAAAAPGAEAAGAPAAEVPAVPAAAPVEAPPPTSAAADASASAGQPVGAGESTATAAGGAEAVESLSAPSITHSPAPVPPPQRVLVVGDENLLFTTGLQQAYPDVEFTAATVLSRQNLEAYNVDPLPAVLGGRIGYMVDPCRVGKHFPQHGFDGIVLFLPGLGFMVPRELGTADRPLFAYRVHLFVFHVLRHAKLVLKGEGKLHLVWPEETSLMTSPCGAAGIEMPQLISFCGCPPTEAQFDMEKVSADYLWPFLFGELPQESLPEWLSGAQIQSFRIDKSPIAIPLSVALLLHPDVGFVSIKDPSREPAAPPPPGTPLRACLVHEANARKDRLKEIYGPKENPEDAADAFGLVPEAFDEESLLSIPMEIFMISFDDIPHLSLLLRFQVCDEQPPASVASLDVLDPRLPTRIARPPPPKTPSPLLAALGLGGRRRARAEEWGGMRFFCPLTQICAPTAERMRAHMQGELYRRLAAGTPGWEDSPERRDLLADLEEAEALEEQQKRARLAGAGPKGKGRGKQGR